MRFTIFYTLLFYVFLVFYVGLETRVVSPNGIGRQLTTGDGKSNVERGPQVASRDTSANGNRTEHRLLCAFVHLCVCAVNERALPVDAVCAHVYVSSSEGGQPYNVHCQCAMCVLVARRVYCCRFVAKSRGNMAGWPCRKHCTRSSNIPGTGRRRRLEEKLIFVAADGARREYYVYAVRENEKSNGIRYYCTVLADC